MKVLPPTETRQARRRETAEARQRIAREAALAAASRLFAENGFHETGMADVAREAGISLKALYGVFGSKDDLFVAVLDESFAQLLPVLADDGHADLAPGDRVLELVDDFLELMEDRQDLVLLYARGSDGVPASLRADGRDPYEPYARVIRDRIEALIRDAQDVGHAPGVPADVIAHSLIATTMAVAADAIRAGRPVTDATPGVRALFESLFTA